VTVMASTMQHCDHILGRCQNRGCNKGTLYAMILVDSLGMH
jgi:hypothetical protein